MLLDIYQQVGKSKDLLTETILNGGVLPDQVAANLDQLDQGGEPDDMYLNNLVGMNQNP